MRRTVGENFQCLLRHRRSGDACVDNAASLIMHNYASDAIPPVQQPIAEATLALMPHLAKSNIHANFLPCIHTHEKVLRSLSKPRRRKLVSLLVELPMDPHVSIKEERVWQLKMLWLVDDDPKRTYAEADQQLLTVVKFETGALKRGLLSLLNRSANAHQKEVSMLVHPATIVAAIVNIIVGIILTIIITIISIIITVTVAIAVTITMIMSLERLQSPQGSEGHSHVL